MHILPKHGKKDLLEAIVIAVIFFIAGVILMNLLPDFSLILLVSVMSGMFYFIIKRNRWKDHQIIKQKFLQIEKSAEAWLVIHQFLQFTFPLKQLSQFAVAPDFAQEILRIVMKHKPKTILELGSGTSTVMLAQMVKQYNPSGKIISIEADENYLVECREELQMHDLSDEASCIHAPYTKLNLKNATHFWYDIEYEKLPQIDLLIVDGPPESLCENARLPALYLLEKKFAKNCIILVDDADRTDMQIVLETWKRDFPHYEYAEIPLTRGAYKITSK